MIFKNVKALLGLFLAQSIYAPAYSLSNATQLIRSGPTDSFKIPMRTSLSNITPHFSKKMWPLSWVSRSNPDYPSPTLWSISPWDLKAQAIYTGPEYSRMLRPINYTNNQLLLHIFGDSIEDKTLLLDPLTGSQQEVLTHSGDARLLEIRTIDSAIISRVIGPEGVALYYKSSLIALPEKIELNTKYIFSLGHYGKDTLIFKVLDQSSREKVVVLSISTDGPKVSKVFFPNGDFRKMSNAIGGSPETGPLFHQITQTNHSEFIQIHPRFGKRTLASSKTSTLESINWFRPLVVNAKHLIFRGQTIDGLYHVYLRPCVSKKDMKGQLIKIVSEKQILKSDIGDAQISSKYGPGIGGAPAIHKSTMALRVNISDKSGTKELGQAIYTFDLEGKLPRCQ